MYLNHNPTIRDTENSNPFPERLHKNSIGSELPSPTVANPLIHRKLTNDINFSITNSSLGTSALSSPTYSTSPEPHIFNAFTDMNTSSHSRSASRAVSSSAASPIMERMPRNVRFDQFDIDDYESDPFSDEATSKSLLRQKKYANIQWLKHALISASLMMLWYFFSLSISIYNKWMFSKDHLNFNFPILTTSGHQLIQFLLSTLVLRCFGHIYKRFVKFTAVKGIDDDADENDNDFDDLEENEGKRSTNKHNNLRELQLTGNYEEAQPLTTDFEDERETNSHRDSIENNNSNNNTLRRSNTISSSNSSTSSTEIQNESSSKRKINAFSSEQAKPSRWEWFRAYIRGIVPTAMASGSDIGLGNASLRIVSLSFYTMVKSSGLGFVLLFGILFKLEVPTPQIFIIIAIMSVGVVMMVAGEAQFSLLGFFLVLGAAMFSGLRWSLTQLLLKGNKHLSSINTHNDPVRTVMYLSPPMGIFLFIWGIFMEGLPSFFAAPLWKEKGALYGVVIMLIPGLIAFLMTLSEFFLLNRTSVLTLSIAGIFKELLTICAATFYFGDELSVVNVIGLIITFIAIVAYNIYRFKRFQMAT